jgi:hypothetical protein
LILVKPGAWRSRRRGRGCDGSANMAARQPYDQQHDEDKPEPAADAITAAAQRACWPDGRNAKIAQAERPARLPAVRRFGSA